MSLLDPLKSVQSGISQLNSAKDSLTLGIKNSKVAEFASLVESRISGTNIVTTVTEGIHNIGMPIQKVSEFSTAIYDTALKLSEAKTVAFDFVNDLSHQHGIFDGGKLYKDFTGTVDKTSSAVKSVSGWFSFNNSSFDFANIKNGTELLNIGISSTSFKPDLVVKDFTPLYDKLKEVKYDKDSSIIDDTKELLSKAATNLFTSAKNILGKSSESDDATKSGDSDSIYNSNNRFGRGVYPAQVTIDRSKDVVNSSVYNSVQAIIYDLPNYSGEIPPYVGESINQLLCFQQPETVSYTVSNQYDSVSPRGSQIPLQFYQVGNAISLSFELKWHIDEIRTLRKSNGTAYTIQEIAQIAEDFTRPWRNDNSLTPKVCKVILPGISHIGYITEAQVSYSGDMSGDYTTGSGIFGNNGISEANNIQTTSGSVNYNGRSDGLVTHYFYSQLSVTFSMLIIKDVKLIPASDTKGLKMDLEPKTLATEPKDNNENAIVSEDNQQPAIDQAQQAENNDAPKADDIPQDEVKPTEDNSANINSPDNENVQKAIEAPEKPITENSAPKKSGSKSSKKKEKEKSKTTNTLTEEKSLEPNMSRIDNASFEDSPPQVSPISSTGEQIQYGQSKFYNTGNTYGYSSQNGYSGYISSASQFMSGKQYC